MARTTKVTQGYRGLEASAPVKQTGKALPTGDARPERQKDGVVVFRTGLNRLMIKVKEGEVYHNRLGNPVIGQSLNVLLSHDQDYETSDPDVISRLKASPNYGWGRDFWALDDELANTRNEAVERARAAISELEAKDPAAAAQLRGELAKLSSDTYELGAQ